MHVCMSADGNFVRRSMLYVQSQYMIEREREQFRDTPLQFSAVNDY
jgi:hypothetical protein